LGGDSLLTGCTNNDFVAEFDEPFEFWVRAGLAQMASYRTEEGFEAVTTGDFV
jgi:hypothetical protein